MAYPKRAANRAELTERRNALDGKRHSVVFYGGWFVVDAINSTRTVKARSLQHAVQIAEHRNMNETPQ